MTDPTRLLDEGATAAELSLLRAGATEEPPESGRQKLSALFGLSAGLSASATAAGSKAAAGVAAKILATKWIVISAAGLVAGGGLLLFAHARAPKDSPYAASTRAESTVAAATAGAIPATTPHALEVPAPPTPRGTTTAKSQVGAGPEQSTATGAKSIGVEIEALDGVRRAMRNHDPGGALRALDAYDHAYPAGTLAQEAALLRIEGLAASGDIAGARARAERFLRDNPRTPHRRRIAALVGDIP